MNLSGNTVLVVGATSGIGRGIALRLHALGNTVVVGGRDPQALGALAAEHPRIATVVIDVTDPASVLAAATDVTMRFPDLDLVISMAGVMLPEDLRSGAGLTVAETTVTTNLLGTIRTVSAFVETLQARPHATIITVSSGLAFVPLPLTPTYNATKAAVHSYTQSLRIQLAETTVRVVELIPPAVRTTLMNQQDSERAMPLDEFLDETIALLAADPDPTEILVEPVKFLRYAERDGRHADVLAMLSAH